VERHSACQCGPAGTAAERIQQPLAWGRIRLGVGLMGVCSGNCHKPRGGRNRASVAPRLRQRPSAMRGSPSEPYLQLMSAPPDLDLLGDRERELDYTAPDDLTALAVADAASRKLANVIQRTPVQATAATCTAAQTSHQGLWFMAVIAFRAARAAISVLRVGYEDQAVVYVRLIDELHNRGQKIRQDQSGHYARQWLDGRSLGKGAKLAGQQFWEMLSGPAHANARAVLDWLAIPHEDGSTKVVLGPERRPDVANSTLIYVAGELRDITAMLLSAAGLPLDELAPLTAAIQAGQIEHWGPDASESGDADRAVR
jgi:hypothetical protein